MFVIKEPVLTEKTFNGIEKNNVYVFLVSPRAKKPQIKRQVEYIFNVKVKKVNTLQEPRKTKRIHKNKGYLPRFKRAILTLEKGYGIAIYPQDPSKAPKEKPLKEQDLKETQDFKGIEEALKNLEVAKEENQTKNLEAETQKTKVSSPKKGKKTETKAEELVLDQKERLPQENQEQTLAKEETKLEPQTASKPKVSKTKTSETKPKKATKKEVKDE